MRPGDIPRRASVGGFAFLTLVALSLVACGGAGTEAASTSNPSSQTTGPLTGPVSFSVSGKVAFQAPVPGARVTVYDALGAMCATTDADGTGAFTASGKCPFPLLLAADLPDPNDQVPLPKDAKGTGAQLYAALAPATKDGQSYTANLTPLTSMVVQLALGRTPGPALANSPKVLSADRLNQAAEKVGAFLQPLASALGSSSLDVNSADFSSGSVIAKMMAMVQVTIQRIPTTKQTQLIIQPAGEFRPIVIVATDGKDIADAYADTALGVDPASVDSARAAKARDASADLAAVLTKTPSQIVALADGCFLHNGTTDPRWIFDDGLGPNTDDTSKVTSVRLHRLNTFTDVANESLEVFNEGGADLAFVSVDFRTRLGHLKRSHFWMVRGSQDLNGCATSGSQWRVLGNRRLVYVRTETYAGHEVMINQQFGARRDTYGTGSEHFVYHGANSAERYTHVLISGPGLPPDGVVFIYLDGNFLRSSSTLLQIRKLGMTKPPGWEKTLVRGVVDSFANSMSDTLIGSISDGFYDPQNRFSYRFFKAPEDLYPALTIFDVLPKRPYLLADLPVDAYPMLSVNYDALVTSLQTSVPIDVRWSLPLDIRGKSVAPFEVWVSRLNCVNAASWPACTTRDLQVNEYEIAAYLPAGTSETQTVLTPPPMLNPAYRTFKGMVRLRVVDSLGRPIESRVGMDYSR